MTAATQAVDQGLAVAARGHRLGNVLLWRMRRQEARNECGQLLASSNGLPCELALQHTEPLNLEESTVVSQ